MNTNYRNIKGTFDILPIDYTEGGNLILSSSKWAFIEKRLREAFERYDFREIRTPILEPTELIARGIGALTDIVSKEMFAFEKGSTHYVLRPEVTAPVLRAYIQHRLDMQGGTQRLFYMSPCFRAERPAKGRFRQFHQFGCEIIGAEDPRADVETIATMMAIYESFGITECHLRLNTLGNASDRPKYKEKLRAYLNPYINDLSEISRQRLEKNPLRILDTKIEHEQVILENAPKLIDCLNKESIERYEWVKDQLSALKIRFVEDAKLVRGLDYYTDTTFELVGDNLGGQNALAGGGRYDLLAVDLGNKNPVPAIGFAAGFERLIISLLAEEYSFPAEKSNDIFLVALGDTARNWVTVKVHELRKKGVRASFDLIGKSMKAQMREADRSQAKWVIIVGDNEIEKNVVALKNMSTGEQKEIEFEQIVSHIRTEQETK